ncbi:MAG: glycosyltransferase family 4 protein [Crocinitomicaceae bacterium]|jgi:glycosyltransferase involved in cell wall biosynthesis|nr:glycosyltransferase family 4 protein [Crocinitomicaceae bacterium]
MRIAINTRFLIKDKMEGFGWFTYEVVQRIVKDHPEHEFYFFFDRPYDARFLFAKNVTPIVINPPARHPILFVLWFEVGVKRALKKHKIDLFFSPDGYLSLAAKTPQVGVIHDINFEHFPLDLPKTASQYLRKFFPRFARKAQHLITVSQYTKLDVARTYGIDQGKISVAWNGVSEKFCVQTEEVKQQTRVAFSNGRPYFLFVGSIHPRKNLKRLLQAYTNLFETGRTDLDLVIVGAQMWKSKNEGVALTENVMEHVHFTGHVNQDDLVRIVGAAHIFTYVPYFEGFGIPLVEAMRSGVPIIAGKLTSLPEVAGNAAEYVDPFSVDEIKLAMELLENDADRRQALIELGLKRSQDFSWDLTAQKVWKVLEKELAKLS